ncbi:MAG: SDR family NAD(P)-dependent oxidoreductase [Pararhizobium sp.]
MDVTGPRHVVVIGGVTGIGRAIAERLLDDGAAVTVLAADAVAVADCSARFEGEDILFLDCDVGDDDEVAEALAQAGAEFGPLTGLVTTPGAAFAAPLERTSAERLREALERSLTAAFVTCKAALDEMAENLAVVHLVPTAGLSPQAGSGACGAAAAGLVMLSKVMAREVAGSGVRINLVAAGGAPAHPETAESVADLQPHEADVISAVLFLLSPASTAINGHVLIADGGLAESAGFSP